MSKINIILGTKAQLIKMAPIMANLTAKNIPYRYVHTGQHNDTFDVLHEGFKIRPPDTTLVQPKEVATYGQMIQWLTSAFKETAFELDKYFPSYTPKDKYLIHGDTFSTLLGAIIGKSLDGIVCHIESGLRSFNYFNPFPEELTRLATFKLTDEYYCPDSVAINNLNKQEGKKINIGGNTLYDSLQLFLEHSKENDEFENNESKRYVVCSIHRYENIFKKKKLKFIVEKIGEISKTLPIKFVLHAATKKRLTKFKLLSKLEENNKISLLPRQSYFNFINLVKNSEFLITDGGSNQEECFYMGVPCLIMRKATERQEGLKTNVVLSNYDPQVISKFIFNYKNYKRQPYTIERSPSEMVVEEIIK